MTDWRAIAIARGIEPEDRIIVPLEQLEAQLLKVQKDIALETEPSIHYVLPEAKR